VDDRPAVIDIHLRVSRRFVVWAVAIFLAMFALTVVWLLLQTVGSSHTAH